MANNFPAVSDHSWARPSPNLIKGSGYLGVMRYIGPNNGPGQRDLSLAEMRTYHEVGLKVGFIVEGDAASVRQGAAKGRQFGEMANDQLSRLGVARDVRIISTAVDYDAQRADLLGPIADYHRAFNDVCAWAGDPYGNDRALNVLVGELGLSPCGWQTRAWSGGRVSPHACMMQEVGYVLANTSDHNSIYRLDDVERLVWHPDDIPGSTPVPPEEDEDMAPRTFMLTSTRANRAWLTRKRDGRPSPGEIAGIVNAAGEPVDLDGKPLEGGWESQWAGLCVWEQIEGCMTTRPLDEQNVNFLKACAWAQAVQKVPVTITDLGFREDQFFSGKTAIPRDSLS